MKLPIRQISFRSAKRNFAPSDGYARRLPFLSRATRVLMLGCSLSFATFASQTTTWEMAGAKDFLKGKMAGVAVTWDGLLRAGYRREEMATPQQPVIWSAVRAPDGTVFLGTGYRGGVYAVRPSGETELIWNATEPAVCALALDARGSLYVATSPNGKIYRIEGDTATELLDPKAQYIWSLAIGSNGVLYAGTGPEGKIYSVNPSGQSEVYYESGQAHITSLAVDSNGRLLAGSEPNGILYGITAKDRGFVLYDAALPEIRSIVVAPGGEIYAAAMGGSVAQKQQLPAASEGGLDSTAPTISTTVTVTAATANPQGGDLQQGVQLPTTGSSGGTASTPLGSTSAIYEIPGVERSAVYRIGTDNTVAQLWSSKEENIFDIALDANGLLMATDREGRIYRMDLRGRASLLAQTEQGQTTRVIPVETGFLAATGNEGKLFRFLPAAAQSAVYESPVHDAQGVAKWGSISWSERSQTPPGATGIRIYTRSGNAFRPDKTWSDWEAVASAAGGRIVSPNARYLQWKAEFVPGAPETTRQADLERVTVAYLPQNSAPTVRSVKVSSQLKASSATGTAATQAAVAASSSAYSITVSATGESDASGPAGSTIASSSRLVEPVVQCTWEADDPDGDTLLYSLAYRAEDEAVWKTIDAEIRETTFIVDASRFADGRYYFRVSATDASDNSPGVSKEDELVSAPVILDHGAPAIEIVAKDRTANGWNLRVRMTDAVSMIRRAEISVNAKPFEVVLPVDGINDSTQEDFVLVVPDDSATEDEKSVVIKGTDAAGNVATARALLSQRR